MSKAVIEDYEQFKIFLASQPLGQWAAQKEREIAAGLHDLHRNPAIRPPAPKNDNAELAAALASMA